ncbi:MAG: histidine--tRNA ligase [Acetivibrionales bacterium]|jgi:histidyl-tRNA synthetase
MFIQSPKGTRDVLPSEVYRWQHVEKVFSELCASFGYREIRTPVFEYTELFQRGVGDSTDIVRKEMYTFNDKSGRSLTLRPEGTAGVVRSYVENGMSSLPHPIKMYYNLSFYRYENVQKGRYREFRQLGAEAFGAAGPSVDVEIISLVDMFFRRLGLKDTSLHINSIGCPRCRAQYQEKLKDYFRPLLSGLCGDCRSRFEINPMRIIDCKRDKCKELTADVPYLLDNLCGECGAHFEGLKAGLENLGIGYIVDPRIVRGLDYYTKTVFEFISENVGTQGTICGGGRYDGLVELCGGTPTPGIGFALGVERLLMELDSQGVVIDQPSTMDIYIATVGVKAAAFAQQLVHKLRSLNVGAETDLMDRSLKAQMKYADKMGFTYIVVVGDEEIESGKGVLKDMRSGEQKDVSLDSIVDRMKNQCKSVPEGSKQ